MQNQGAGLLINEIKYPCIFIPTTCMAVSTQSGNIFSSEVNAVSSIPKFSCDVICISCTGVG